MDLAFLTPDVPPIGGRLRTSPEDFRVEEIPAYAPTGEGEHLYVTFEKRERTTPEAVEALAKALAVNPSACGWAGLKDRHAVTVQTASLPGAEPERALALADTLPGLRVLSAVRHRNKLRTGHLHGNRFVIVVRGCVPDAEAHAQAVVDVLGRVGIPNYFGAQRFGRDGDNAQKGRAWLAGGRPPGKPFLRKMFVSALQSELFNAWLDARVRDGLMATYVDGDLAVRHPLDRWFAIDPAEARETYASLACSPTGPIFGTRMAQPTGEACVREERVLTAGELTREAFGRAGNLGEGTRRAARMKPDGLEVSAARTADGCDLTLRFSLPAGGYATAVLRELRKTDDESLPSGPALSHESPLDPAIVA